MTEHTLHPALPVDVEIRNWPEGWAKPRLVKKTIFQTFVLDAASPGNLRVQICDLEPHRVRIHLMVIDAPIGISNDQPGTVPGVSAVGTAPYGAIIAANALGHDLYGPDAMWIYSLGAQTRVSVVKEYA